MKKIQGVLVLMGVALITACNTDNESIGSDNGMNQLTPEEIQQGWISLFNGQDSGQWRGYQRQNLPGGWDVIDGTLHMKGLANMNEAERQSRGDIVYPEKLQNFILKLEWKISPGGNSGIFYLGQEQQDQDFIWRTAPEMQILDNQQHPDANKGKMGNRQAGSLYDLIPATPQNAKAPGQWNQIEIKVQRRHVTHHQNGKIVVEYQLDTPEWQALVATSKFPGLNPQWHQVAQQGFIGLQDHSDPVWFRNIKLKKL